jgi:hypothetical protein
MFGKKLSGQKTQKLFMTPAVSSAVAPSARNFQEIQQVIPPHTQAFTGTHFLSSFKQLPT